MINSYNPEAWRELFMMLGGSVAALTGLLFVATSIHINNIRKTPHWRIRAFGNTFALISLLIEASLVLMPQNRVLLGAELIVTNLLVLFFIPVRIFVHLSRLDAKIPTVRLVSGMAAWALGAAGGAGLIVEIGGGMYLVVIAYLCLIWICILNAWSLMTATYKT